MMLPPPRSAASSCVDSLVSFMTPIACDGRVSPRHALLVIASARDERSGRRADRSERVMTAHPAAVHAGKMITDLRVDDSAVTSG